MLDTLRWLKHETDVWFEITNLVIPQANDSLDEIRQMCDWILDHLGHDVPLHFTAFHPDFRLEDRGPTPPETLLAAYDVARSLGLNYVYAGNVHAPREGSTWCPGCGELLIERDWYELGRYQLDGNRCRSCGYQLAGRFDQGRGNWGRKRLPVRIAEFSSAGAKLGSVASRLPIVDFKQERTAFPTTNMNDTTTMTPELQVAVRSAARPDLTDEQKQTLVRAAARVVSATAAGQPITLADAGLEAFSDVPVLGAFVTLKRQGRLRSCCGAMSQAVTLGARRVSRRGALGHRRSSFSVGHGASSLPTSTSTCGFCTASRK